MFKSNDGQYTKFQVLTKYLSNTELPYTILSNVTVAIVALMHGVQTQLVCVEAEMCHSHHMLTALQGLWAKCDAPLKAQYDKASLEFGIPTSFVGLAEY